MKLKRILTCGDLHIRFTTPGMRMEEDFFEQVCVPKLEWLVSTANDEDAVILIAGDIFDVATSRYLLPNTIAPILKKARYTPIAIPGQHDMNHHSQLLMDTPYMALVEMGAIRNAHSKVVDGVHGAGFGVEPNPKLKADILLAHFCVTEKEPPFFLSEALSAEDYLDKHSEYKVIVTGDYHVPHVTEKDGRLLINCGPLFRKEQTQIDFLPRVYLIDLDNLDCECIYIPIVPGADAFDLAKIAKSKSMGISEEDMDTSALRDMLMADKETAIEFPDVVALVSKQFTEERNIKINTERLNNFLQRARV